MPKGMGQSGDLGFDGSGVGLGLETNELALFGLSKPVTC